MPELPEVETIKKGLARQLPGRVIAGVEVLRPQSIGYPSPAQFCKLLPGHKFEQIERRGKYLLMVLDGGAWLVVHLRMSGRLLLAAKRRPPDRHLRVKIMLAGGQELHFEDMRVFGRLWYVFPGQDLMQIVPGLSTLGVEPTAGLSAGMLKQAFRGKARSIKSALLDQSLVAGLGNIYADESLFHSGINPLKSVSCLTLEELSILVEKILAVLARAIALGGSSIRDYMDSSGVAGGYQDQTFVYGRTGLPCRRCAGTIERVKHNGRSTHFCRQCQPLSLRRHRVSI